MVHTDGPAYVCAINNPNEVFTLNDNDNDANDDDDNDGDMPDGDNLGGLMASI